MDNIKNAILAYGTSIGFFVILYTFTGDALYQKEDFTNDDYVEAMLVLINSVQNSLFDFTDKIDALLKKVDEKEN